MPPRVSGVNNKVIRQSEEQFETDRFGVDTIVFKVEIPDALFPAQALRNYAPHPRFANMMLSRRSGARTKPGFWQIAYTFEGFLFEPPEPVYELQASLDERPIQLHPDFESKIAGTPANPKNSAIFVDPDTGLITQSNDNAVFKEFKHPSNKAGLEAYLVPGAEWREIIFTTTRPATLRQLGKIENPAGPAPTLPDHNWMFFGQTYTRRGGVYQTTNTWKLSGKGGHDPDIYS